MFWFESIVYCFFLVPSGRTLAEFVRVGIVCHKSNEKIRLENNYLSKDKVDLSWILKYSKIIYI